MTIARMTIVTTTAMVMETANALVATDMDHMAMGMAAMALICFIMAATVMAGTALPVTASTHNILPPILRLPVR